eukprot:CAMPEP_0113542326 /NCGR_PEP_ID=MMETSP0015_2-20120614/9544_1 /TAXON_ID=2838 /ORGANISM="Odontella" /LENGTH=551 /DNA_ID=CAMNT_0000442369 /DNA_START=292 /DNA_END=1947 /DNA_ORIENTATION=- /assembly_acc=CAM_ASM_000160
MKSSMGALSAALFLSGAAVDGFAVPKSTSTSTSAFALRRTAMRMSAGEFDHILGEGWQNQQQQSQQQGQQQQQQQQSQQQQQQQQQRQSRSRRALLLRVPDGSPAVTHASSITAPRTTGEDDVFAEEEDVFADAQVNGGAEGEGGSSARGDGLDSFQSSVSGDAVSDDPYIQEILRKQQLKQVQSSPFDPKSFLEGKDFTDIFFTVLLPLGGAAYGAKWLYGRGTDKMADNADEGLDDYAREMCYHDGDFDEMKLCHSDYKKKLTWLGPNKKDRMLTTYLETYAKKVTVSPRSISSLSYAFSLYKLSEDKAAKTLSDLCLTMPEKTASVGKLLFFGTHILKSDSARTKLEPIREMLASSYREDVGISGEDIVDNSQKAMAEAAYRDAVTKAGKDQDDLTVGWEVLGLDKETAERIFDEERDAGFVSSKEAKYSRAKLKYDDKGRRVDAAGKVVIEGDERGEEGDSAKTPEAANEDNDEVSEDKPKGAWEGGDDEDDGEGGDQQVANVYECGNCGYTLFVAEGRDHKFFGSGFTCPECGADKDKFVGRTAGE